MVKLLQHQAIGKSRRLVTDGDSLTATALFQQALKNRLPNRIIDNQGIPGQKADQIACRMGGLPIRVSLTGGAFNGLNPVVLTSVSVPFLSSAAVAGPNTMFGSINGINCYITRTATLVGQNYVDAAYTITPLFTSAAAVADGSIFIPDTALNNKYDIHIMWLGRNNVPNELSGLENIINNCLKFAIGEPKRVIINGVKNSTSGIIGTPEYTAVRAKNEILKSLWPLNFVDMTPPTSEEVSRLGLTLSSQDLLDIDNGIIPQSMHSDAVHLNATGSALIAMRDADLINEYGW